jgi:hypothetical protein
MKLLLLRYSDNNESTQGLLFIDGIFQCYTLEDEYRAKKKWGETRIPKGNYRILLRKSGLTHNKYKKRFPEMHKGTLHLQDVPGFEYILIHIGNKDEDTAGCILVGDTVNNNQSGKGFLKNSTDAYKKIYPLIANAIETDKVTIRVIDLERHFGGKDET